MSVFIERSQLTISASCSYFQPRRFPNGILRDEGHITTWIVILSWKVNLNCKVIICLNNCPRNCVHKFDEEQQRQKTSTVHLATDSSGGFSRFFFILRRVDECQERFTKTPILHQLLEHKIFISFSTRGRESLQCF